LGSGGNLVNIDAYFPEAKSWEIISSIKFKLFSSLIMGHAIRVKVQKPAPKTYLIG
jgi:hypothetical protein